MDGSRDEEKEFYGYSFRSIGNNVNDYEDADNFSCNGENRGTLVKENEYDQQLFHGIGYNLNDYEGSVRLGR